MKNAFAFLAVLCLMLLAACGGQTEESASDKPERSAGDSPGYEPEVMDTSEPIETGEWTMMHGNSRIHYKVVGQGPPCLVLTNSWGLNFRPLSRMFAQLEDTFTLIYFDPRGMGNSKAVEEDADMSMATVRADGLAVLNHLGVQKAYVMGWSNGGSNTYLFCGENPDRVLGGIVIHGLETMTDEDRAHMNEFSASMAEQYMQYMAAMNDPDKSDGEKESIHKEMFMQFFASMIVDLEMSETALKEAFSVAQFSYRHAMYSNTVDQPAFDASAMLSSISAPMLLLAGAHDAVPPSSMQRAADALQNCTFIVMENSGHFGPLEEPEVFRQAVEQFVASTK